MSRVPSTGTVLGPGEAFLARPDAFPFRDEGSIAEWMISGLDQREQDQVYLPLSQGGGTRYPIRFGALAAHALEGSALKEITLIPFLFVAPTRTVAWEARCILRIGPTPSARLLSDLEPMAAPLEGHFLRVTDVSSFTDPRFGRWFSDLDLLLALDSESLRAIVGGCPALGRAHEVPLAEDLDWHAIAGCSLVPLGRFVRCADLDSVSPGTPPSPLRLCAWMGAALVHSRGPALSHLLDFVRGALPEPSKPERENR